MEDKLLGYMQWPEIEAIIYSEHDRPKQILGPHKVDEGILIQAYFPGAEKCEILVKGQEAVEMREVDEDYFAILLSEEAIPGYHCPGGQGEACHCIPDTYPSMPWRSPSAFGPSHP